MRIPPFGANGKEPHYVGHVYAEGMCLPTTYPLDTEGVLPPGTEVDQRCFAIGVFRNALRRAENVTLTINHRDVIGSTSDGGLQLECDQFGLAVGVCGHPELDAMPIVGLSGTITTTRAKIADPRVLVILELELREIAIVTLPQLPMAPLTWLWPNGNDARARRAALNRAAADMLRGAEQFSDSKIIMDTLRGVVNA